MSFSFLQRVIRRGIVGLALVTASLLSMASELQRFPDVLDATVTQSGSQWRVSATLSSPYDTPDRYADGFRVLTPEGDELGVRTLWHDHASEQPFTRSLTGVEIPNGLDSVIVQGRDQQHGWGGQAVRVRLSDGNVDVLAQWPE